MAESASSLSVRQRQHDIVREEQAALGEHQAAVALPQQALVEERLRAFWVHVGRADAGARAEAEEHRLEAFLVPIEDLLAADRPVTPLDGLEVLLRRAEVPPAAAVAPRVRAGTESEVRAALPVAEV